MVPPFQGFDLFVADDPGRCSWAGINCAFGASNVDDFCFAFSALSSIASFARGV
jgi:hypothetical protein